MSKRSINCPSISINDLAVLNILTLRKQLQIGKVCSIEKLQYMALQYLTHSMDQLQVLSKNVKVEYKL